MNAVSELSIWEWSQFKFVLKLHLLEVKKKTDAQPLTSFKKGL